MLSRSCGAGELGEVVGGADQGPFGADFLDTAQQELPEPPCLLDLSEHRLDDLLSEPVSTSPAGALELLPHRRGQRPRELAFAVGGALCAPGRGVNPGPACCQGPQLRLLASAGVRPSFSGRPVWVALCP